MRSKMTSGNEDKEAMQLCLMCDIKWRIQLMI